MSAGTEQRTSFTKVIRPGTIPRGASGRMHVFCKIQFDGETQSLSFSGVEGPQSNGDADACGQIEMHYAHRDYRDDDARYAIRIAPEAFKFAAGWDTELWLDFLDAWHHWHLNHMRASCDHQRELGWDRLANEKVTVHYLRLKREVSTRKRQIEEEALAALKRGETVTLSAEDHTLVNLPYNLMGFDPGSFALKAPAPFDDPYEPDTARMGGPSEEKPRGFVHPHHHPDGLLGKHCPECGYAYGSQWKSERVPDEVLDFLRSLPDADRTPAWV